MTVKELKEWRIKNHGSMAKAAEWFGVDRATWWKYENKVHPIPKPLLNRLALKGLGDKREEEG